MIDECHLLWNNLCGYVWGNTDERVEIPMTNQRSKQTYYGALDYGTKEFLVKPYQKADSQYTVEFVKYLQKQRPNQRITLIWDRASYHQYDKMKEYLEEIEEILQGLWDFGKVIEGKMREKGSFKGLEGLRDEYKQSLMRLRLLEEERLAEAMLDRYGEGVLRVIHPEMMDDLEEYVSGCLLGCDLLQEVDRVVHSLVEGIL